jgi:hypothetical protein
MQTLAGCQYKSQKREHRPAFGRSLTQASLTWRRRLDRPICNVIGEGIRAMNHVLAIGWVAEWLKAPVLKTGGPARVPWVRIPPHPPN